LADQSLELTRFRGHRQIYGGGPRWEDHFVLNSTPMAAVVRSGRTSMTCSANSRGHANRSI